MRAARLLPTSAFVAALLFVGMLRHAATTPNLLTPLAPYATPAYVAITVAFAIALARSGETLNRFGFGYRLRPAHLAGAVAGVVLLQLVSAFLEPLWERALGSARDLERFEHVQGSVAGLASLLALNWTFAAFGEELAFRILLMRGISSALNDTAAAAVTALLLQAAVFGAVHWYQGPSGVIGATASGLVFGLLTLAARGAIWPAALAHGANNSIGLVRLYLGG